MERKIIHIDLDAFFCSVEELNNPELRGKPFAVGGKPDQRGVIASCTYAARRFGIHSAMPSSRAIRLCPELIILSSRHSKYSNYSRKVMAILAEFSSIIQQISIDEAFIDVSESQKEVKQIAIEIQTKINNTLNLPCSLGVATNKLVSKIANDVGKLKNQNKTPPNTITIVTPGKEREFLEPLPVEMLWGVGPSTGKKLKNIGVITIGDLANVKTESLTKLFGKVGYSLSVRAKGIDETPVYSKREIKSISRETTFRNDIKDTMHLINTLQKLSHDVAERAKHSRKIGFTVKIKLRWSDFTTITRQKRLTTPTNEYDKIFLEASILLRDNLVKGKTVRLIGVGISSLISIDKNIQLSFIDSKMNIKNSSLERIVEEVNEIFGFEVVRRGF